MFRKMVDLCFLLLLVLPTSSYSSETERDPSKPKGSDALFPIHYGQQWGFINREGSVIITPQFDRVGAFFHGIAQVTVIRDG